MPALGRAFGGDREAVQLTLTMFMFGIAIGQLVHGPISDRFGRKPAIVGGLCVNVLATAGCALSDSIEILAVFRFIHGVAASSGWLIARRYPGPTRTRRRGARDVSHADFPYCGTIVVADHRCVSDGALRLAGHVHLSVRLFAGNHNFLRSDLSRNNSGNCSRCVEAGADGPHLCGNIAEQGVLSLYRMRHRDV